jgi:hypothetical protein
MLGADTVTKMYSPTKQMRSATDCAVSRLFTRDTPFRIYHSIPEQSPRESVGMAHNPGNEPNSTTMRNMPFDNKIGDSDQRQITLMQSSQQIGATLYMLGNLETCFSPMFAIQFAALLMTLVRKSIIDSTAWHIIYNLSLWINVFCFYSRSLSIGYVVFQPVVYYALYYLRFSFDNDSFSPDSSLPMKDASLRKGRNGNVILGNKYVCWTAVFVAFYIYDVAKFDKKIANIFDTYYGNEFDMIVRHIIIWVYLVIQLQKSRGLLSAFRSPHYEDIRLFTE